MYGLGQYGNGRPFYAMRFIHGDSLKTALEAFHRADNPNRSDPGARQLELRRLLGRFIDICDAIGYAHSRHVIHRDLKPGNVMLGKYGETLVVDWGLAKPVGRKEKATGDETLRPNSPLSGSDESQEGSVVGTLAYMSPEQAAGRLDQIGTATDIYALGATLYHVLTGQAPFHGKKEEVQPLVIRGEFPPPRARNADVPRALEAICLKAMALNRGDRYSDTRSLADDLEHWLSDEPVQAYREPWTIRAARWCRHHRTLVVSSSALFFVILVATAIGSIAVSAERARTAIATREAEANQRAAAAVATLLDDIFRTADPMGLEGFGLRQSTQRVAEVTARQLLDAGVRQVGDHLNDQPAVHAALFDTMGNTYRGLGDYRAAEEFLTKSLDLRRQLHGEEHADVAASLFALGMLRQDTNRNGEAEQLYRKALELQVRFLGADDLAVARTKLQIAWLLSHQPFEVNPINTITAEAEQLVRDALDIRRAKLGANHRDVGVTLAILAAIRMARGSEQDAKALAIQAAMILVQSPDGGDFRNAVMHIMNGQIARNLRRHHEAIEHYKQANEIARFQLGAEHPLYALLVGNLAGTQRQAGDMAGAEKSVLEFLAIARKTSLRFHPLALDAFIQVADELRGRGDLAEAESHYREAIKYATEAGAAGAPYVQRASQRLDDLLKKQDPPPDPDPPKK